MADSAYVKEGEHGDGPESGAAPDEDGSKAQSRTLVLLVSDIIYVAIFFALFTELGCESRVYLPSAPRASARAAYPRMAVGWLLS